MSRLYDILTELVQSKRNLQVGYLSGRNVPANSYLDIPVTFSREMRSAPQVILTFASTSTSTDLGFISLSSINVTKTGFTARIFNGASSQRTPGVRWIAYAE